jgi:hypothetical protein
MLHPALAWTASPLRLIPIRKRWQAGAFGWVEPQCYGDELARVVYFAHFVIWAGLVSESMKLQVQLTLIAGVSSRLASHLHRKKRPAAVRQGGRGEGPR